MKFILTSLLMFVLNSCTYSVSMQHSEGSTDTQEEAQTANPNVDPSLTIPAVGK